MPRSQILVTEEKLKQVGDRHTEIRELVAGAFGSSVESVTQTIHAFGEYDDSNHAIHCIVVTHKDNVTVDNELADIFAPFLGTFLEGEETAYVSVSNPDTGESSWVIITAAAE